MKGKDVFIILGVLATSLFAYLQYKTIDKNLSEATESINEVKKKVDKFL